MVNEEWSIGKSPGTDCAFPLYLENITQNKIGFTSLWCGGIPPPPVADGHGGSDVHVARVDGKRALVVLDRQQILPGVVIEVSGVDEGLEIVRILPEDLPVVLDLVQGVQVDHIAPRPPGGFLLAATGRREEGQQYRARDRHLSYAAPFHIGLTSSGSRHAVRSSLTLSPPGGTEISGAISATGARQNRRTGIFGGGSARCGSRTNGFPLRMMSMSSSRGPKR